MENTMKYLLMMQIDRDVFNALTPDDWAAIGSGHQSLIDDTKASGEFVATEALADPSHSAVLRKGPTAPVVLDGPFAEAKEFMGGFYIFDVESRERALELASRIPDLEYEGFAVEVRAILAQGGDDS
jgi:hypothetical protein